MGFFSKDTIDDCLNLVNKVNSEFRAIIALFHSGPTYGVDNSNYYSVKRHLNNIITYSEKYDNIRSNLSIIDRVNLDAMEVPLWDGIKTVSVNWRFMVIQCWEQINHILQTK